MRIPAIRIIEIIPKYCFYLFLFSLFFNSYIFSQCQHDVLYYKGFFYTVNYNEIDSKYTISENGYLSFDQLTKENIDSLSLKDSYKFDRYNNDSIGICSLHFQFFFNGLKWAVFKNGIKTTDFKYDNATYPFVLKQIESNEEKRCILVQIGTDFGLLNELGKELTAVIYKLSEMNVNYLYDDSIVFTGNQTPIKMNSTYFRAKDYENTSYPLAGSLIILSKNNKIGAIDTLGNEIILFNYDTIIYSNHGCHRASRQGKQYYITSKGMELEGYDAVIPIWLYLEDGYLKKKTFSGIYMIKQNGKWGMINSLNNLKVKCLFEIASEEETFLTTSNMYSDGLWYKKKYYKFEVRKNELILQDVDDKDVLKDFIEM